MLTTPVDDIPLLRSPAVTLLDPPGLQSQTWIFQILYRLALGLLARSKVCLDWISESMGSSSFSSIATYQR